MLRLRAQPVHCRGGLPAAVDAADDGGLLPQLRVPLLRGLRRRAVRADAGGLWGVRDTVRPQVRQQHAALRRRGGALHAAGGRLDRCHVPLARRPERLLDDAVPVPPDVRGDARRERERRRRLAVDARAARGARRPARRLLPGPQRLCPRRHDGRLRQRLRDVGLGAARKQRRGGPPRDRQRGRRPGERARRRRPVHRLRAVAVPHRGGLQRGGDAEHAQRVVPRVHLPVQARLPRRQVRDRRGEQRAVRVALQGGVRGAGRRDDARRRGRSRRAAGAEPREHGRHAARLGAGDGPDAGGDGRRRVAAAEPVRGGVDGRGGGGGRRRVGVDGGPPRGRLLHHRRRRVRPDAVPPARRGAVAALRQLLVGRGGAADCRCDEPAVRGGCQRPGRLPGRRRAAEPRRGRRLRDGPPAVLREGALAVRRWPRLRRRRHRPRHRRLLAELRLRLPRRVRRRAVRRADRCPHSRGRGGPRQRQRQSPRRGAALRIGLHAALRGDAAVARRSGPAVRGAEQQRPLAPRDAPDGCRRDRRRRPRRRAPAVDAAVGRPPRSRWCRRRSGVAVGDRPPRACPHWHGPISECVPPFVPQHVRRRVGGDAAALPVGGAVGAGGRGQRLRARRRRAAAARQRAVRG